MSPTGGSSSSATDMELGIRVGLEATDDADGTVVVPGRLLLDVVRSLPKDDLSLEYRSARAGRRAGVRPGALPPAHPSRRGLPEAARGRPSRGRPDACPAAAFVETIARVARAASRDETRPHLTGVLVSASEQELRMVATDSYRLSVKETQLEEALERLARGERAGADAAGAEPDRRRGRRARRSASPRSRTRSCSPSTTWCCPRAWSRAASRTTSSCCPTRTSTSCG